MRAMRGEISFEIQVSLDVRVWNASLVCGQRLIHAHMSDKIHRISDMPERRRACGQP